jgi:hypothetical protein
MRTVSDIIDGLGGNTAVARIIGKGPSTVSEMKRRGAVPVEYWPALVLAASDADVAGRDRRAVFILTNDMLVAAHVGQVAA